MYAQMGQDFYSLNMKQLCDEVLARCAICSQYRSLRNRPMGLLPNFDLSLGDIYNLILYVNLKGPINAGLPGQLPKKHWVLCTLESTSRWVCFSLVKDTSGEETARALFTDVICKLGTPVLIVSDWGSHFCNSVHWFKSLLGISISPC